MEQTGFITIVFIVVMKKIAVIDEEYLNHYQKELSKKNYVIIYLKILMKH